MKIIETVSTPCVRVYRWPASWDVWLDVWGASGEIAEMRAGQ